MSRLPVLSCGPGYTDPVYLDELGVVSGLSIVYGPNGPLSASWALNVDADYDHRALHPGRIILIPAGGGFCWGGRLSTPGRGNPWQMSADGIAAAGLRFQSYDPSGNGLSLNDSVDEAVTRGLPFFRIGSLPALIDGDPSAGSRTIADALNTVADSEGQVWQVDPVGGLTMTDPPTVKRFLIVATDPAEGRTLDDYISTLLVLYMDSTTLLPTTVVVSNPSSVARFGGNEDVLDLTDQDFMSAAAATTAGERKLRTLIPRAGFSGQFTVTYGQVLTVGGVVCDLTALDCSALYQVIQVDPDVGGELDPATPTTIGLSEIDVDVDADVATLTPLDSPRRDEVLANGRLVTA